jgi:hypothetical protein
MKPFQYILFASSELELWKKGRQAPVNVEIELLALLLDRGADIAVCSIMDYVGG